jgi:hypothetical protein
LCPSVHQSWYIYLQCSFEEDHYQVSCHHLIMRVSDAFSKLACFSHGNPNNSPPPEETDMFRERGQAQLRAIITESNLQSVDWNAVIQKASELHQLEQKRLRHGYQPKDRTKHEKRAIERRKRNDKAGSFSCNMRTYCRADEEEGINQGLLTPRRQRAGSRGSSASPAFTSYDSSSNASRSPGTDSM